MIKNWQAMANDWMLRVIGEKSKSTTIFPGITSKQNRAEQAQQYSLEKKIGMRKIPSCTGIYKSKFSINKVKLEIHTWKYVFKYKN